MIHLGHYYSVAACSPCSSVDAWAAAAALLTTTWARLYRCKIYTHVHVRYIRRYCIDKKYTSIYYLKISPSWSTIPALVSSSTIPSSAPSPSTTDTASCRAGSYLLPTSVRTYIQIQANGKEYKGGERRIYALYSSNSSKAYQQRTLYTHTSEIH